MRTLHDAAAHSVEKSSYLCVKLNFKSVTTAEMLMKDNFAARCR